MNKDKPPLEAWRSRAEYARYRMRTLVRSELSPGDRIPSEQQLAKDFQVSRNTIRETLNELNSAGWLDRKWGVGTFVSPTAALLQTSTITEFRPIPETIRISGRRCSIDFASYEPWDGTEPHYAELPLRRLLEVDEEEPVWHLERLYLADDVPAVWMCEYVPQSIDERELDPSELVEDITDLLRSQCGVELHSADARLEPILAAPEIADRLAIKPGTPLLLNAQTAYSDQARPIVYTETCIRTDVVQHRIVRARTD